MVSFNVDYWEVVEYGVDDFGCEYDVVVSRNLTERDAKWQAAELMCGRDDFEEVFYMARKM